MFTVFSKRDGKDFTHQVKALKIIWTLFPQLYDTPYSKFPSTNPFTVTPIHQPSSSAHNTIHIDDLGRNFALNPNEGLKIAPFRYAHTLQASQDRELESLAIYLNHIATAPSFKEFTHKEWKRVVGGLGLP